MKKPTGDCFKVHGQAILDMPFKSLEVLKDCPLPGDVLLVHGTVIGTGKIEGIPHIHCWLEIGEVVVDIANGLSGIVPAFIYYQVGRVQAQPDKLIKYTPKQAAKKMLTTGHFGPWDI